MTTFDEDFQKAITAAETTDGSEDVNVYLYYPSDLATATKGQKTSFETLWKQWGKLVRTEGSGDLIGAAERIAAHSRQVGFDFAEIVRGMLYPSTVRNEIAKAVREAHGKTGNFVRFNVRSPKGRKIAFWG